MIEVEHIHAIPFETYLVRFTRTATLSAVPQVGFVIDYAVGLYAIDEVVLKDGGGIQVLTWEKNQTGEFVTYPDSMYEEEKNGMIEEMDWNLLSDTKTRKTRVPGSYEF